MQSRWPCASVDRDGMKKELFYVAASRGREGITVITSDAEVLRESVASSTARRSATELARAARVSFERGLRRGLSETREFVTDPRPQPPRPDVARKTVSVS